MENERQKFKIEFKRRLYNWVLRLIKFIDGLPRSPINDIIGKQLLRSGTSILANYTEAYSACSKKDFLNFFSYSLKSSNESEMWLNLLKDTGKGNLDELKWLTQELSELSKILAKSILTLKGKK
ncbi:MAG: hypothetical protein UT63_C0049G0014 [Candidatus Gottesmanbacteria bacterium GW2011_GWC2_39_8]|uniref:Four helix bundle protein n=1 Tax=Candidatus Gottesmanbacteria bacterium GW2011_GWC2_39_8 TaxID=1618450 RepID=A0A0G0SBW6_9BACT|nr:MAG: hypothetical protein UT63_C0049G0014 [Candidatus Gottesmanbacteria bacterium GW2011_GWC2_39_8]